MAGLGELERAHDAFAQRNTRIVAVSVEPVDEARKTQQTFPHLVVLADPEKNLTTAAALVHPHQGPDGGDIAVPATVLVDRNGTVAWMEQPGNLSERPSAAALITAVDQHLPTR
jgi:peroxiredoxin